MRKLPTRIRQYAHQLGFATLMGLMGSGVAQGSAVGDIRATVNGERIAFPDVQPLVIRNRVMVPIRGVFEQMNSNVDWDENAQLITARRGSKDVRIRINEKTATINGERVPLSTPAVLVGGRAMVPLRALGEMLGANVQWEGNTNTVEITTAESSGTPNTRQHTMRMTIAVDTVIPFQLNRTLTSDRAQRGERFEAALDITDSDRYQGLIAGTVLEGHVGLSRSRTANRPGVLSLAFDRLRLPDGTAYTFRAVQVGLDRESVENVKGRWIALPGAREDLKYVGYGASGVILVSLFTKNSYISDAAMSAALDDVMGRNRAKNEQYRDAVIEEGTKFGIRLTQDFTFRVLTPADR